MHRWFRFCAAIALIAPAFPFGTALGEGVPPSADLAALGELSEPLTPPKHKLRPTLQQIVEQQSKKIDLQSKLIATQSKQIEYQSKQVEQIGTRLDLEGKQIEAQGKQIDALQAQLAHATALLEELGRNRAPAPAAPAPQSPRVMTATPGQASPAEPSFVPQEAPAPASQPALDPNAPTHIVKKGETLIAIAHQHGTTVSELLKLNKIENERKLQIGQTLILPPSAAATPPQNNPQVP